MAATGLEQSHGLTVEQWDDQISSEYLGKIVFKPFMKMDQNSAIRVKENLAKSAGDLLHIGLRAGLDGAGVENDANMEGNEEEITFYEQGVRLTQYRNAVLLKGKLSEKRAAFSMRNEAKAALAEWHAQKAEKEIAKAFNTINGVVYATASESNKDAWLADNADRVLFGSARSNNAGNDHSVCLAEIDSTNDKLDSDIISLAKRMAITANPKIRPIKIENGVEFYVMFVHPYAFRDLLADTAIQQAQREVFPRLGNMHPLLNGQAFLYWNGVLVVESEKVLLLDGVGNGSIDVAANVLLGSEAIVYCQGGYVDGLRMSWTEQEYDYGNKWGFCQAQVFGIEKARFNTGGSSTAKDHGMVTVYTSAVGD